MKYRRDRFKIHGNYEESGDFHELLSLHGNYFVYTFGFSHDERVVKCLTPITVSEARDIRRGKTYRGR